MRKLTKFIIVVICILLVGALVGGVIGGVKRNKAKNDDSPTTTKHVHTEVVYNGKAATCTTTGFSDGKYCSECGLITVKRQTLPIIAHNYVNSVCVMCDNW